MENNLKKVTYLLGAGASAEALPIIKDSQEKAGLSTSMMVLANELEKEKNNFGFELNDILSYIIEDLKWINEETNNKRKTVDTLAQQLYKQDDTRSFNRLKRTLSFFFAHRQFVSKVFDYRYEDFVTKNINKDRIFFPNVKILNWNYDFQLQLAAEKYKKENFVGNYESGVLNYFPSPIVDFHNHPSINLVHLNGIATYFKDSIHNQIAHFNVGGRVNSHRTLLNFIKDVGETTPLFTFAFEDNCKHRPN